MIEIRPKAVDKFFLPLLWTPSIVFKKMMFLLYLDIFVFLNACLLLVTTYYDVVFVHYIIDFFSIHKILHFGYCQFILIYTNLFDMQVSMAA